MWIALAIVAIALIGGFFLTRRLFSQPLRQLERESVPIAQDYMRRVMSDDSPDPELRGMLAPRIGTYEASRPVDLATASGKSTGIAIQLRMRGSNGQADALVLLDLKDGKYEVTRAEMVF